MSGPPTDGALPSAPRGRPSSRRSDDADVIRARLRALLDEARRPGGWLPDDLPEDEDDEPLEPRTPQDSAPTAPAREPDPEEEESRLPSGLGRHRAPHNA